MLSLQKLQNIVFQKEKFILENEFSPEKLEKIILKIKNNRNYIVKKIQENQIIYGVNTGFGANAHKIIPQHETHELQRRLVISHACGVGENLPFEVIRGMMLLRVLGLMQGHSGIRWEVIERLIMMLNEEIYPEVPAQGSVGASGDLCPLSHIACALIGEGNVFLGKENLKKINAKEYFEQNNIPLIVLEAKEALALINGTALMASWGLVINYEGKKLFSLIMQSFALAFEGLLARNAPFDEKIHLNRPSSKGQAFVAEFIRNCTENSTLFGVSTLTLLKNIPKNIFGILPKNIQEEIELVKSVKQYAFSKHFYHNIFEFSEKNQNIENETWDSWETFFRLIDKKQIPQDAYSVRCSPQVLGASYDALERLGEVVLGESASVVDNPLIFEAENEVLSGGNFHGEPLALVLDYAKIALAEIGSISERLVNKLVDAGHNDFLPPFLVENAGLNSGFMVAQYVCAGIVSENKTLAHPDSVDSIPTSANQEDHVSMGANAGRHAYRILENLKKITAILLLVSAQAVDLRKKQLSKLDLEIKLGKETEKLYQKIREVVPYLKEDRFLHEDIRKMILVVNEI